MKMDHFDRKELFHRRKTHIDSLKDQLPSLSSLYYYIWDEDEFTHLLVN